MVKIFEKIGIQPKTGYFIIALFIVAAVIIVILSWPKPTPIPVVGIINEAQAKIETQYKAQLKEKDNQILDYQNKLVVSQGKYNALVQRFNQLQKEKENVKAPTTNLELRNRFTALGYTPLPAK